MKKFFNLLLGAMFALVFMQSCGNRAQETQEAQEVQGGFIMTVMGPLPVEEMGITLVHEHIFTDFRGAAVFSRELWDIDAAFDVALPHLQALKPFGFATFIDCTPEYIGRFPLLLKRLSEATGINILTPTGIYAALDNKFVPYYAFDKTAEELANSWLAEWHYGIDDTGIHPGLIKIGVSGEEALCELHERIVVAAAKTHLGSGMVIVSHTGPAHLAFLQLEVLVREGVSPEAFIWAHAQDAMREPETHLKAASMGAWVGFDGLTEYNVPYYARMIHHMRDNGMLHKVLLSHDAGWFDPNLPNGGNFRPFTTLFEQLLPMLREEGFTEEEIHQLMVINPARAHEIRVRKL